MRFWTKHTIIYFLCIALLGLAVRVPPVCAQQALQFPATPKKAVTDEYHGVKVIDEYRWLEDSGDPAVRRWLDEQNKFSRSLLEKMPARAAIATRLKNLYDDRPTIYYNFYQRKMFFAMKSEPGKNQPLLVMLNSPDDPASERVILDPNVLNPKGTTAIDFYAPSLDGRFVAVSLSENGSEDGSAHVYETASGKKLPDVIPRVQYPTAGGSLEWDKDASGFYYTRFPRGGERPPEDMTFYQQVYFHKLGTQTSEDTYVIGKEFPRIAEITLSTTEDAKYLLASVANGDGGEFAHYLRGPSGTWTQLTRFSDQVKSVLFGPNGTLYLLTVNGAPRGKILSAPLDDPKLSGAKTVVPESDATIESFIPAATRLYVAEMKGGPSEVAVFDLGGKRLSSVPVKPVSSVLLGLRLKGDEILYGSVSYLETFTWYRFDPATGAVTKTRLAGTTSVNFDDAQVVRDFAVSKDGTRIPINIVSRKGVKLDGKNPTILYGYGGYGVNMTPSFRRKNRLWLDAGGVYVEANLRGGSEYGEEWHRAGKLTKKQNVFDDFIACAKYLIEKKYTSPDRLAIEGGSNGGLLMGAALTQHPELFRAVVGYAGWYDMLRVELSPNGAFNVPELGTVKDPEQFRALHAYSPYHRVRDNTAYPAVLFITGDNDGRVDPMHSRKMAARLQAATSSKLPVLLRTSSDTGHGAGSSLGARIAQESEVLAFLFDQLGMAPPA
ncbi:MAG TPA: prolyl oligopeptidase family serine peptidase [Pyrinomonadaceae bacterium]|nr:prolyl oligopeptidase family serine peptidase [Pyrinomonadaceae bacterium]